MSVNGKTVFFMGYPMGFGAADFWERKKIKLLTNQYSVWYNAPDANMLIDQQMNDSVRRFGSVPDNGTGASYRRIE